MAAREQEDARILSFVDGLDEHHVARPFTYRMLDLVAFLRETA
jgi:hypothetical protein